MKLPMFKWLSVLMSVTAAVVFVSCTSELKVGEGDLDLTITVGGDSLAFPLGSTDEISLSDFLDMDSVESLYLDENGNYYLETGKSFEEEIFVSDYAENLTVEGFMKDFEERSYMVSSEVDVPDLGIVNVNFDFEESFAYIFSFEDARSAGLVSISRVNFDNTWLVPHVSVRSDVPLSSGIRLQLEIEVPEEFVLENSPTVSGTSVVFEGEVLSSGNVDFQPVFIDGLLLDIEENEPFEMEYGFTVKDLSLSVDSDIFPELDGTELVIAVGVSAGSDDGFLHPSSFYGKVDIVIDDIIEGITIDGVPGYLKEDDVYLDFTSPYALVRFNTNSGVPFIIDADIRPYFGAQPDNQAVQLAFDAPVSENPDNVETAAYWLSWERPSALEPSYQWKQADIQALVSRIPDSLRITVSPYSDLNSAKEHFIDCMASYDLSCDIDFVLPFAFGDKLYVPVRDTLTGIPEEIGTALCNADISIMGDITSTFPVAIGVSGYFLDSSGRPLDIEVRYQKVGSVAADGMPISTPLNITVCRSEQAAEIASLVMEFELLPGETPGMSLSDRSWMKADIVIGVSGGLTLDLSENDQ